MSDSYEWAYNGRGYLANQAFNPREDNEGYEDDDDDFDDDVFDDEPPITLDDDQDDL